ncbi:MAG: AAA family ATPase, partial [Deltaproteobacteria bacterium]|nr:AAA family ATPase [Deltaproteobacteria bacterium]
QGLSPFFDDALLKAKLTNLARFFSEHEGALIITGNDIRLPEEAKPYSAYFTPPAPTRQDYARLLKSIYNDLKDRMPLKVDMDRQDMNRLLNNLQGLSLLEAGKILTKAMIEDGSLSPDDISLVVQAKKSIVERDGLLEYFPTSEGLADIADLKTLKAWLAKRKSIIINSRKASQFGLIFPKGILLLGVPGSGKSLCAKAVAREWGLPLLKMDPSGLYNKYIGESEKNFSRAMQAAEKMAPVILWIDEIEKAFASGGSEDGGVSQRVLGIFLSWMQERKGEVFVVATCNDVAKLPPELLRKGRFDELFFVDLPDNETRSAIFKIHLKKRGRDPQLFDFGALAEVTDGFSGAEIEQVVISALYDAFSDETPLNTELLLEEARRTYPLSRTRAEHIEALRKWARGRTVGAN